MARLGRGRPNRPVIVRNSRADAEDGAANPVMWSAGTPRPKWRAFAPRGRWDTDAPAPKWTARAPQGG